eukprot:13186149-Alexandrium_andersonii.AAC.1
MVCAARTSMGRASTVDTCNTFSIQRSTTNDHRVGLRTRDARTAQHMRNVRCVSLAHPQYAQRCATCTMG